MSVISYIKRSGIKSFLYKSVDLVRYKLGDSFYKWKFKRNWEKFLTSGKIGITDEKRVADIIVSLTSFPARIYDVETTIQSLLMQKTKPNKIILWLGEEKFCNKEADLPESLLELRKYGLSIEWCKDIGPYTKLVPALRKYPDAAIITVDDDIIYPRNLVKKLYNAFETQPEYIHCNRITKYYIDHLGKYHMIAGGWDYYKKPSFMQKQTGVGGVIYPPNCMYKDVIREDIFMEIAHLNDDTWFWLMGVLNGVKVNVIKNPNLILHYVGNTQEADSMYLINGEFILSEFYNILERYPRLKTILKDENEKVNAAIINIY